MPRWLLLCFVLHYLPFTLDIICSFNPTIWIFEISDHSKFLSPGVCPFVHHSSPCSPDWQVCYWAWIELCESDRQLHMYFQPMLACIFPQRRTWNNRLKLLIHVHRLIHCNLLLFRTAWSTLGICADDYLLSRCTIQHFHQTNNKLASSLSKLLCIQGLPCSKYPCSPFWFSIIC